MLELTEHRGQWSVVGNIFHETGTVAMAFILEKESHPFENHQNSICLFHGKFLLTQKINRLNVRTILTLVKWPIKS